MENLLRSFALSTAQSRQLAKRTLVAFLFGMLMSFVFVAGSALKLDPIERLERASVDFAARVATSIFTFSEDEVALPAKASRIIMIDVDEEACALVADARACRYDRIGQSALFETIFSSTAEFSPAATIIDIFLDPEIGRELSEQISSFPGQIYLPMDMRESGDGAPLFALENSFCGELECGNAAFLPALVRSQDGRSRYYSYELPVRISSPGNLTEKTVVLPTLPAKVATQTGTHYLVATSAEHAVSFALPTFALANEEQRIKLRKSHMGNIGYYSLADLISDDGQTIEWPDGSAGAIVIIGSSAAAGRDLHNTPIGPMAGMELLTNTIRSMQIAEADTEPSFWEALFAKIKAVLIALLVLAVGEYFLLRSEISRSTAHECNRPTVSAGCFWDRYSWAFLLVLTGILLGELAIAIWQILAEMEDPATRAGAVDVIWPIIGVILSALIAFAGKIVGKIEWLVDWAMACPQRFWEQKPGAK